MSEIADAFRRIERPNVRTNTSVQPFNCALRSFAQACFQRMKQQLYWVKVRRIFRQVAQACTDSLDRRFHTPNLVEGDIVDHHNVPALERWDQTLAAWVPTVEPQHVSGDCRLVDKYEVGRIKKALHPNPASARAGDVGALALCRPQTFFDGDAMASEKSGQRAAAAWDTPLVKRRNDLIQREVRLLADEREDLPRG